jgi:Superfamily I DNA and RNA helicases
MDNGLKDKFLKLRKEILKKSFSKMNDRQLEAIFCVEGPLMVLAGAGSGKTTVIVNRIANMIRYGNAYNSDVVPDGLNEEMIRRLEDSLNAKESDYTVDNLLKVNPIDPMEILAITFTNKAANELKGRLASLIPDGKGSAVWAATFHSTCARILRIHAQAIGYSKNFTIYDSDDSKKILKECQKALKIDERDLSLKSIAYEISLAKDKLLSAKDMGSTGDYRLCKIAEVYKIYQNRLKEADAMDFDDLIGNTIKLFKECPDVLEKYQSRFKYIMVDEFQDVNFAQSVFVDLISKVSGNLCVVGDDDQSIYKFRGATVDYIINFEKNHSGTKTVRLEQNYRSTKNILNAANSIIQNNLNRKGKTLWTNNPEGEKIIVHTAYNEHDEANYIVNIIRQKVENGASYSDFAILYRMNSQSNVIEKAFVKSSIPYRIFGGARFYDRKEIKDMIAYLSVINNLSDEVRLRRIINQPRRSIGERTIAQAVEIAHSENLDLIEVIKNASSYELLQRVAIKLESFYKMLNELIVASTNPTVSLHELYQMILDKTGYIEFLKTDKEDCKSRIENVEELMNSIMRYEEENGENATLSGFLEEVSLLTDIDNYDENADCVIMMTMHSAKGLEFPEVFLPAFEEGIFPGIQAICDDAELEEERRLAYVALTRAKKNLYILNSDSRMVYGSTSYNKCSRFIEEISDNLIEKSKSRDWKKMDPSLEIPQSAQEIRTKSTIAARHFGQIVGGATQQQIFNIGDEVSHSAFGQGRILAVTQMGKDSLLEIDFEGTEGNKTKKLMANFARLQKI